MKIGFIGLGIMGESMCENIVKKHDDTVYCFDFCSGARSLANRARSVSNITPA